MREDDPKRRTLLPTVFSALEGREMDGVLDFNAWLDALEQDLAQPDGSDERIDAEAMLFSLFTLSLYKRG